MHDLRVLREQLDQLRDGMRRRGALDTLAPIIDRGAEAERERRALIQAVEEKKAARNSNAQEVAKRKKAKLGSEANRAVIPITGFDVAFPDLLQGRAGKLELS